MRSKQNRSQIKTMPSKSKRFFDLLKFICKQNKKGNKIFLKINLTLEI